MFASLDLGRLFDPSGEVGVLIYVYSNPELFSKYYLVTDVALVQAQDARSLFLGTYLTSVRMRSSRGSLVNTSQAAIQAVSPPFCA